MALDIQSFLSKLQSLASPGSTMSQAGNMDAYQKHLMESQIQGIKPMTYEEFQKSLQQPIQQPVYQQGLLGR